MSLPADWFRALPKVELHVHLDGSLRPPTLLELGREAGVPLPADTPGDLAAAMLVRDAKNLEEYLARYRYTLAVLQTPAALRRVARELVEDLAAENVLHAEIRFCPALHTPAMDPIDAVRAAWTGIEDARDGGTTARLIVCGLRTLPPDVSVRMAELAAMSKDLGVVGFDLAGAEAGHPARDHAAAFAVARDAGVRLTCHAGESAGPESIREAVERCGAERIGHGTRLHDDPALADELRDRRIPLEVCITSNLHTRAVPDAASHPVREYVRDGHAVTLNTDGRLMDGITLSDEFATAHGDLGLDASALVDRVYDACEHAFLDDDERAALRARLEPGLAGALESARSFEGSA